MAIFESSCSPCHGPHGEGLAGAPPIIGATALPRFPRDSAGIPLYKDPNQIQRENAQRVPGQPSRQELVTALDLHAHVKQHVSRLPRQQIAQRNFSDSDYFNLVTFILIAHGADVPESGINEANAGAIKIRP